MVEGCTCMHATGLRWYEECFHRALTGLRVIRLELDKGHRVVRGVWSWNTRVSHKSWSSSSEIGTLRRGSVSGRLFGGECQVSIYISCKRTTELISQKVSWTTQHVGLVSKEIWWRIFWLRLWHAKHLLSFKNLWSTLPLWQGSQANWLESPQPMQQSQASSFDRLPRRARSLTNEKRLPSLTSNSILHTSCSFVFRTPKPISTQSSPPNINSSQLSSTP